MFESFPLLVALDLLGIFVFAISGGLVGVRKNLDIFGVLVLAGTTGLGGGFLRDVLIDATPPASLTDWRYLMVPVVAGLVTFYFHPTLVRRRAERVVTFFDAAGLGLFCVTGALKALDHGQQGDVHPRRPWALQLSAPGCGIDRRGEVRPLHDEGQPGAPGRVLPGRLLRLRLHRQQ